MALKIIAIALLSFFLTGCDQFKYLEKLEQAQQQNRELIQQIEMQRGKHLADIEHWQREATIAAACDYLINICPKAQNGQVAIDTGSYSGGGTLFWALVIGKFALISSALGALWLTLHLGFLKLIEPARAELEKARATVASAEAEAQDALSRSVRLRSEIERLESRRDALEAECDELQQQLKSQRDELEATKSARDLLGDDDDF